VLLDNRKIRISTFSIVKGVPTASHVAEAWQEGEHLVVSGLWDDLMPYPMEDHDLMANDAGVSSLEWLRQRLLVQPFISLEVIS